MLKFFGFQKVPARTLYQIVAGIFICAAALTAFFFYWRYYTTDELAEFVGDDAVLYLQIKEPLFSARSPLYAQKELHQAHTLVDSVMGWNLNFSEQLAPLMNRQAAVVLVERDGVHKILLIKTKKFFETERVLSAYNHYWVKKNIVAVSPDTIVLDDNIFTPTHSLALKLQQNFKQYNFFKLYVSPDGLRTFFNQIFSRDTADIFATELYIAANPKDDMWRVRFNLYQDGMRERSASFFAHATESEALKGSISSEHFLFYAKGIPLDLLFSQYGIISGSSDKSDRKEQSNSLSVFRKEFAKRNVAPLLEPTFEAAILTPAVSGESFFIAAISLKDVRDFDMLLQQIAAWLSFEQPQDKTVRLPDQSFATHQLIEPVAIAFRQIDDALYTTDTTWSPVVYKYSDKTILISNSQEELKQYLNTVGPVRDNKISIGSRCWKHVPQSFIVLSAEMLETVLMSAYMDTAYLFVGSDETGTMSGCIMN